MQYCPPETVDAFPCGCETVTKVVKAATAQLSLQSKIPKVATAVLELRTGSSRAELQHLTLPRHANADFGNFGFEHFWFACHDGTTVRVATLDETLMERTCDEVYNSSHAIKLCLKSAHQRCKRCPPREWATDHIVWDPLPSLCRGEVYEDKPGLLLFYLATAMYQLGAECRIGLLNSTRPTPSECSPPPPKPSATAAAAAAAAEDDENKMDDHLDHEEEGAEEEAAATTPPPPPSVEQASKYTPEAGACDRFMQNVNCLLNKAWKWMWQRLPYLPITHTLLFFLAVYSMLFLFTCLSFLLGRMIARAAFPVYLCFLLPLILLLNAVLIVAPHIPDLLDMVKKFAEHVEYDER